MNAINEGEKYDGLNEKLIEELMLSKRCYYGLKRAEINTLEELIEVIHSKRLKSIRHIGVASINEIQHALKMLGICLK